MERALSSDPSPTPAPHSAARRSTGACQGLSARCGGRSSTLFAERCRAVGSAGRPGACVLGDGGRVARVDELAALSGCELFGLPALRRRAGGEVAGALLAVWPQDPGSPGTVRALLNAHV